jgi:hypothetical protein
MSRHVRTGTPRWISAVHGGVAGLDVAQVLLSGRVQ